jgi:S-DNA-T family DNA segregation ATPase FtsK/SpoIIIE
MHIELTGRYRGQDSDVAIEASESALLSDVLPQLARTVRAPIDAPAWSTDRLLAPDSPLVGSGMRTGGVVTFGERPPPAAGSGVLSVRVIGGPNAGEIRSLSPGRLVVGRDATCDLTLTDGDVSRRHAALDVTAAAITVHDLASTNGTRLNGDVVPPTGARAAPGSLITLGDSTLLLTGPGDPPAATQPDCDGSSLVLRAPRRVERWPADEIVLPQRAAGSAPHRVQWLAAILPAVAGAAMAWFAHTPQFLLFALLSPAMLLSTALGDRVHWRRSRRRDAATYRQRRADLDATVRHRLTIEAGARRRAAPDPAAITEHAALPGCRIWERRRGDPDMLSLRLGLTELPSSLLVRDDDCTRPAGTLDAVPACVDLRRGPFGVSGPDALVDALGRWLVGQLAVLHSPADVELALLLDPERAVAWAWARWLPQLRHRVATSSEDGAALVAELSAVVEHRLSDVHDTSLWGGGWLVVIIDRAGRLTDLPALDALLTRGARTGVTVICLDTATAALPAACVTVAQAHGPTGTRLAVRGAGTTVPCTVVADQVTTQWAEDVARSLAPLRDASGGIATVPLRCTLLDVLRMPDLEVSAIETRWQASEGGARVTLGLGPDGPVELDLERDGPHALVAGTTGSGKSELLQTIVVGLAANHPPDELNVVLIDYKGGSAFAECARLPHAIGLVTDLDQYLTERALRALTSELRRRERLFASTGARDLSEFQRSADQAPVPRIVIVVDEFAALAEELPDFVRGLIAVAQRGRSLGVHLMLATQRPGAAVSAEIRANTSVRIALRVTDAVESNDVIDAPDAAAISRACPGRAYLRVGESLTRFQTAHAAATSPMKRSDVSVQLLGAWRREAESLHAEAESQLAVLVRALGRAAQHSGRRPAQQVWLAPLPDQLAMHDIQPVATATAIAIGTIDLPDEQRAIPFSLDLAAGPSLLLAGASRSGRTCALAATALAAAERLAPDDLHLHVVDPSGALARVLAPLAHCTTVLGPDDISLAPRLLHRLEAEAARRAAAGSSTAGATASLVLLIDGWETMCGLLSDLDAAHCAERLAGVLRVGPAAGLTVIVSGDRTTLAPRFSGGFGERLLLRLADRTDFAFAGVRPTDVPPTLPPGRAIRASDGSLVQLAHPGTAPGPAEWQRCATDIARRSTKRARDGRAVAIRALPTRIALPDLPAPTGQLVLGVAGDEAQPVTFDPFSGGRRILIIGPARSGRSTTLQLLATQAATTSLTTLVAAPQRSPLAATAQQLRLPLVDPACADRAFPLHATPALVLVDDSEAFADTLVGDQLTALARSSGADVSIIAAACSEDLATAYRGLGAELRRSRCGILLRPGPVDGELLGVRLPRRSPTGPPGRGIAVGDASWGSLFDTGEPVPIQIATP